MILAWFALKWRMSSDNFWSSFSQIAKTFNQLCSKTLLATLFNPIFLLLNQTWSFLVWIVQSFANGRDSFNLLDLFSEFALMSLMTASFCCSSLVLLLLASCDPFWQKSANFHLLCLLLANWQCNWNEFETNQRFFFLQEKQGSVFCCRILSPFFGATMWSKSWLDLIQNRAFQKQCFLFVNFLFLSAIISLKMASASFVKVFLQLWFSPHDHVWSFSLCQFSKINSGEVEDCKEKNRWRDL